MNILPDIDICFNALVHMYYLVFLRRLKHGGLWMGRLFLPTWRCHLLFWRLWPTRKDRVLRLRERLVCHGMSALVVLEVTVECPREPWLNGF
jgi:hypothetical protein